MLTSKLCLYIKHVQKNRRQQMRLTSKFLVLERRQKPIKTSSTNALDPTQRNNRYARVKPILGAETIWPRLICFEAKRLHHVNFWGSGGSRVAFFAKINYLFDLCAVLVVQSSNFVDLHFSPSRTWIRTLFSTVSIENVISKNRYYQTQTYLSF